MHVTIKFLLAVSIIFSQGFDDLPYVLVKPIKT